MTCVWIDNGSTFWPPEGWHGLDPLDWPRTAEVWIKWGDEAERRRIMDRKQRLRCGLAVYGGARRVECSAEGVGERWAREHWKAEHEGTAVRFSRVHKRWMYEMMGFADIYDGKPMGWFEVLDGADPREATYEADALTLGDRAACFLRAEPYEPLESVAQSDAASRSRALSQSEQSDEQVAP